MGGSSFVRRTFCESIKYQEGRGENPQLGNAYLWLEIAMRNALVMYVLYICGTNVSIKLRTRTGVTRRWAYRKCGAYLRRDVLSHGLGQPIMREYVIQQVPAVYKFQHEVYKTNPSSENNI
jgi:hypothetical protein